MGLRVNTNLNALSALRSLRINDALQSRSLERLSTGLRINRAADDPAGLVVSETLRAQIAGLGQAVENLQNGSNLLATADAALQEISDLLIDIQDSIVFAQNTSGATDAEIAAEQSSVDQALAAIDRIASTTRFGDRPLLNGNADFALESNRPPELQDLSVRGVEFNPGETSRAFDVTVTEVPLRGRLRFETVSSVTSGTILRVIGPRGAQDVTLAVGAGAAAASGLAGAVNAQAGFTGVFASASGQDVDLFTESFGTAQTVRVELIAGTISGGGAGGQLLFAENDTGSLGTLSATGAGTILSTGEAASDGGRNGTVAFDGAEFDGLGNEFSIQTRSAQFSFRLDPDRLAYAVSGAAGTISTGTQASFTVANTGLTFQLNTRPLPTDRLTFGIGGVASIFLGTEATRDRIAEAGAGISTGAAEADQVLRGGFLSSLQSGGANDLTANPDNAGSIARAAIDQVALLRGFVGSLDADTLQPLRAAAELHRDNLAASLSFVRDLDVAAETAAFTRSQILFQSSLIALASANIIPQAVLTLVG